MCPFSWQVSSTHGSVCYAVKANTTQVCEYSIESWADFINKFENNLFVTAVQLEYEGKSPLNEN